MKGEKPSPEELLELLRRDRGECPEPAQLLMGHRRQLSPREDERMQAHVEACGFCQLSLKLIAEWEAASQETGAGEAPDWKNIEARLRKNVLAFAPGREKAPNPFERLFFNLKGILWRPAVAYLIVLVLLYPAYRGTLLVRKVESPKTAEPRAGYLAGTSRIVTLEQQDLRGTARTPNRLTLSPEDGFATLQFFVPIRVAPHITYSADIQSLGETVARVEKLTSFDGLGNFALVCPKDILVPGSYVLAVEEYDQQKNERTARFSFQFEVAR